MLNTKWCFIYRNHGVKLVHMRKMKFTFCFLLWPILFFGQIQLDQIEEYKSLVDVADVQVLYVDQKESFERVKEKNFSHTYTQSDFPGYKKVLWLKIKLINKDILNQDYYIYSTIPHFTVFQEMDNVWKQTTNGYLAPLKYREKSRSNRFLPLETKLFGETTLYVRLQNGRLSRTQSYVGIAAEKFHFQMLQNQEDYNRTTSIFSLIYFAGLSMVFIFIIMM